MRTLAKNLGVAIQIDKAIQGRIYRQTKPDGTARAFLDDICAEFNLVWYFDGQTLYVTPSDKLRIEIFTFEKNDVEAVLDTLKQLDLYAYRFTHKYTKHDKILLVRGPDPYLKVLKQTFEALEKNEPPKVAVLRGSPSTSFPYMPPIPPAQPNLLRPPQK
ncbi:hypothetical protein DUT91_24225 [Phyllobacterium salinisoli]|uniref:Uncharacterized protein n=2 Tax=Phyllobacterium salinisoli TaxID=1899321 RepID=A0A368JY97_9HYPH|nr:hypothetical protein DUT91_24225 [Phyllobacterium salinisoli]